MMSSDDFCLIQISFWMPMTDGTAGAKMWEEGTPGESVLRGGMRFPNI